MLFSTIAFGLGIDIPDVRHVVIVFRSKNIEEFWQMANRAGRDSAVASVCTHCMFEPYRVQVSLYYRNVGTKRKHHFDDYMESLPVLRSCQRLQVLSYLGSNLSCGQGVGCGSCSACARNGNRLPAGSEEPLIPAGQERQGVTAVARNPNRSERLLQRKHVLNSEFRTRYLCKRKRMEREEEMVAELWKQACELCTELGGSSTIAGTRLILMAVSLFSR